MGASTATTATDEIAGTIFESNAEGLDQKRHPPSKSIVNVSLYWKMEKECDLLDLDVVIKSDVQEFVSVH